MKMVAGQTNYGLKLGMNVRYHFETDRIDKLMAGTMEALRSGATFIEYRAKQLVPVRTGLLKGSITMKELEEPKKGYMVGPDTYYDIYVEFGTGFRGEGRKILGDKWKTKIAGQRAQPYMRPALAEAKPRIAKELQENVRKVLS